MELKETLLRLERELGAGTGDDYRRLLIDDAIVVVPGQSLTKAQCAAAMDATSGWREMQMDDVRLLSLSDESALITYRFTGARPDLRYTALMGSVYVRREGGWRMAYHQQTPL